MQENKIIINKDILVKFLIFIKSPITALFFAVLLSIFFYFLSKSEKSPCYYYSKPTLIAEKSTADLKILFKGKEVDNVYYTNLTLWNEGTDYIDYSDFIESKPISFFSSDSLKILSVNILKKSREELNFTYNFNDSIVNIKLSNDEALEENDGVCFHILYTTNKENEEFNLTSRIKGEIEGFIFKDLNNFKKSNSKFSIYFLWIVIVLLLSIRIITLVIAEREIVFRKSEVVFIGMLLVFAIYYTINYIFYTTNLEWLN